MTFLVELEIDDPRWKRHRGLGARVTRAAHLALVRTNAGRSGSLTILLTQNRRLRSLNRNFRGQDRPTNVLSFPAPKNREQYLGDVAVAYGVTQKEAKALGRMFADHATHLAVHGVLHLLGFDHATKRQQRQMEPMERRILAELGIADPYAEAA